jgi:hypothetical protein
MTGDYAGLGPSGFLFGVVVLGCGWWLLWNCSGRWPDDRRNLGLGILLCLVGAYLIFWGAHQIDPALATAIAQ